MLIINKDICIRFKQVRVSLGYHQYYFAIRLNMSQGHISAIENLRKNVTNDKIKLLVYEFNVSEEWLRTGKGEMFNSTNKLVELFHTKVNDLEYNEQKILMNILSMSKNKRKDILQYVEKLMDN